MTTYSVLGNGLVVIQPVCTSCGREVEDFIITESQLNLYLAGNRPHVQDIFPELSAAQRELFVSGICDPCWQRLFPPEEE